MGVIVRYKIGGTIPCPECGHIIDLSDPNRKKEQNSKSTSGKHHNYNIIGWSVVIAIIAGWLISHFLK